MDVRPDKQLWLPLNGGEASRAEPAPSNPVNHEQLMEQILERDNLFRALRRVEQNAGSPGVDGMTVEQLRPYLRRHWPEIRRLLHAGTYTPQPVKRVEIPKSRGRTRKLGVPAVLDRCIQQAILQVLQETWDASFSEASYGFRPGRSAHQAVEQAQVYVRDNCRWVVDIDLENFFDRVNHDKLMSEVEKRVSDKRVADVIRRYLTAGVFIDKEFCETPEGTPQGGPLSPLLANLLLDELDRELEKRGHRFVRYADDCNIYVRSRRAGNRVMGSITRFLADRLKLRVNREKSSVTRPWYCRFLGFTFTSRGKRRTVSDKATRQFKDRVRKITRRTRGRTIGQVITELGRYLTGWRAYFGFAETRTVFKALDSWIQRRLRCYLWKQWGRRGYRELRKRGVSAQLAWNTSKSAHGPWRLSRSPALAFALTTRAFSKLGLPRLLV